jgi:hypothetical protein
MKKVFARFICLIFLPAITLLGSVPLRAQVTWDGYSTSLATKLSVACDGLTNYKLGQEFVSGKISDFFGVFFVTDLLIPIHLQDGQTRTLTSWSWNGQQVFDCPLTPTEQQFTFP